MARQKMSQNFTSGRYLDTSALIALTIPDLQGVGYFSVSCNWNTSRKLLKTVIAAININMQVLQIETSSSYFTLQITIDETFLRNFLEY